MEEVGDARAQSLFLAFADMAGRLVPLKLAEAPAESDLLLVGQRLVAEYEHPVSLHRRIDRADVGRLERPGAIDAGGLAGEGARYRLYREGHSDPPDCRMEPELRAVRWAP